MPDKPILIIHPQDNTTKFLNRVKNHLIESFSDQVHHFNVHPNDRSHKDCLARIAKHPETGFIIFLGHGRSDKLYGAKGKKYGSLVSFEATLEYPDEYYYNDDFINIDNIDIFSGKKVFCLSCNSNEKLAHYALDKGAILFLGFGDIPTSRGEMTDRNGDVSNELIIKIKTELNYIIKTSLFYGIRMKFTFQELLNLIKFITSQRIAEVKINQKYFKERNTLSDILYCVKKETIIYGNNKLKMID
jgi:hypothetical protein